MLSTLQRFDSLRPDFSMKRKINSYFAALMLCSILVYPLAAQPQKCAPPVALPASTEPNFFTNEKETYLGDAIAEHIQKFYRVIEDEAVTQHLSQIGERLTANLPLSKLRFQFFLVDFHAAKAFVLSCVHIYVSCECVSLVHRCSELTSN